MTITGISTALALAGFMALTAGAPAQAQERALRRVTAGEPATLNKAATERQARRACETQFKGSRESRSATRQKVTLCVNQAMQGN